MSRMPSVSTAEVDRSLKTLAGNMPEVIAYAQDLAGEGILSEAQTEAPIKSGVLKESAIKERSPDGKRTFIGFLAKYAAAVHARHPTKAGWFRDAIREHAPRIIVASVKKALEEKGGINGTAS